MLICALLTPNGYLTCLDFSGTLMVNEDEDNGIG